MAGNGLKAFSFHALNPDDAPAATTLQAERGRFRGLVVAGTAPETLDPETVARNHLAQAFASSALPTLNAPAANGHVNEFKTLGTETLPLTGTKTVKFRQYQDKIPVYGSLVTVELDERNELLGINSSLGEPANIDPVAKVAPAQAFEVVRKASGLGAQTPCRVGRLSHYFDGGMKRWRLTYIFEDVPCVPSARSDDGGHAHGHQGHGALLMDYVVDAHTGALVAELPRMPSFDTVEITADDGLGKPRTVSVSRNGIRSHMHDPEFNVHTHDLNFGDISTSQLPGKYCQNPPEWTGAAVSAHANAVEVARFLRDVLKRNGIDNAGGPLVSSVNCVSAQMGANGKEWLNAAWIGTQMVYGQRKEGDDFRSYAVGLDIVAHEMLHGVTDHTARLEYVSQSGALNESYSDIFGVILSNLEIQNRDEWNWEMGEDLSGTGVPLRNLADPAAYGQPDHMDLYADLPRWVDNGGVHHNSGIHNKAAHLILTARNADDAPLFDAGTAAALFYIALTQYLSRQSTFDDSRRGIEQAAFTLFRSLPKEHIALRVEAIRDAFDRVGIRDRAAALV